MPNWWVKVSIAVAALVVLHCGDRTRNVGGTTRPSGTSAPGASTTTPAANTNPDAEPNPDPGGEKPLGRVMHIALETSLIDEEADPPQSSLDLVVTDETGRVDRVEIAELTGTCVDVTAQHKSDPMKPVLSTDCLYNGSGTLFRLVPRHGHIIVLRAHIEAGVDEELAFDEHKRIPVPEGVPVTTD